MLRSAAAFLMLSVALAAVPASAEDLAFTVINTTSSQLTEFYTSPVASDDWEDNMVSDPIDAGEKAQASIADGRDVCEYDIRAVFADGDKVEEENVNLCELGSYTLHE